MSTRAEGGREAVQDTTGSYNTGNKYGYFSEHYKYSAWLNQWPTFAVEISTFRSIDVVKSFNTSMDYTNQLLMNLLLMPIKIPKVSRTKNVP